MANDIYTYDTLDIDLKSSSRVSVKCKQLDDIVLNFDIYNDGAIENIENYNVELRVVKPDNKFVIQSKDIMKKGNNIKIECIQDITREKGRAKGELRFVNKNNKQKTSFDVIIDIKPGVLDGSEGESQNVITIIEELDTAIDEARKIIEDLGDDIEKIVSTGNNDYNVTTGMWVSNTDASIEALYKYNINHGMGSENLQVEVKDATTKMSVLATYKIIDKMNLMMYSNVKVALNVVISASYYNGSQEVSVRDEVIDARIGQKSLGDKIRLIDASMEDIVTFVGDDLQSSINNFNKEGKLHIKSGIHRINNKLILSSDMIISGKFNKSILRLSDNAPITASIMYGESIENIVVENIVFDGFGLNRDSDLYYHGGVEGSNRDMKIVDVEFKNCKNITVRNCVFKEGIYGSIRFTDCENVNFENNLILSSYGHGLIVDKSYNCFIENNRIFKCGKDSRYPIGLNGCGIVFIDQSSSNQTSHTNIVTNNIVGNCREGGISYEGHRRIISNNIIFNSGLEKSAIKSMSHTIGDENKHNSFRRKQHLIHGNMIIGSLNSTSCTKLAIHCVGSDIEVQGNFIFNRSNEDYTTGKSNGLRDGSSIYIQSIHDGGVEYSGDTRNVFVSNNYIKNVLGRGIYISGGNVYAKNIEIKNNKIVNTFDGGIVSDKTNGIHIEGNLLQNCCPGTLSTIDKPIYVIKGINRLLINNNKIIFDDTELPFENKIKTETDGNIELSYCVPKVCQINSNVITGNYSNAIRFVNCDIKDLQVILNMIKPHDTQTSPNSTSGIIFTSSTIERVNLSNNNIINCNNRGIYLDGVSSGVVSGNITDISTQCVYMKSNVKKCVISNNVGGRISMAGSSNNINNLITSNIVSDFGFIDSSNGNIVSNNNINYP